MLHLVWLQHFSEFSQAFALLVFDFAIPVTDDKSALNVFDCFCCTYVRGVSVYVVCVWRVIVVDFYLVFHKAVEMVLQLAGLPTSLPLSLYFCLFLSVSLSIYCHYVAHDDIYDYCYKI